MSSPMESIPPLPTSSKYKETLQRHPLLFYFLIAYAISWILTVPFILAEWNIIHWASHQLSFIVKSFGPALAAFIMTSAIEGEAGIQRFRQGIRAWRTGWHWYPLILLGIPALILAGIIVQPGAAAGFLGFAPGLLVNYLVMFVVVAFGGGPLGEEPGWRGFALPRMQRLYGPLRGTLILGVLWTGWHLPDFLTSAQGGGPGTNFSAFLINFPAFFVLVTALSVIFTWIFNHNRGSVLIAILAHASVNTPQLVLVPLFPAVDVTRMNLAALIGFGIPALLIGILTRGRLGYSSDRE